MSESVAALRQATRTLRRAPAFTALAIAILATGIGATVAMYSLVQAALSRTLPFEDPDRLVWMYNTRTERDRAPLSVPDVEDYRREASSLAGLAVFTNWTTNLTGVGSPERLDGLRVAGNFFELLGAHASLGRLLRPDDEDREARVIVLTDGLWQRRFGGDPGVVGNEVSLNGATYTVVGVLPPRFLFPFREAELATPISLRSEPRRSDRGANFLRVVARLSPTATAGQAKAELDSIAHRLQALYPTENARKIGISLYPLHAEIVRDYRGMLWTLFTAVGVLLLVGCMNLANLLLLRAAERRAEFTIRTSLGATRGQLACQVLCETAVLSAVGGVLGTALAYIGLAAWRAWGPADFPQMADVSLDRDVLLFAAFTAGMTALACGAVPAWFASRGGSGVVRGAARTTTTSRAQLGAQRAFVATQIGAATVLLISTLLMAQGLARLERVEPGFTPSQALSLQLSLQPSTYGSPEALSRFFDAVRDRLGAIPGIESAGAVSLLPLSGLLSTVDVALPDRPPPAADQVPQAHFRVASSEYFDAAGIPLLEGRPFNDFDRRDGQPVAIVSHTMAMRHWPGESALGKFVQIVQDAASPRMQVVGVVGDVKQFTLDAAPTADLYVPLQQMPAFQAQFVAARMNWVVRSRGNGAAMTEAIRSAVGEVDPGVAASSVRTLESLWLTSLGSRRANAHLLIAFGSVALVLCAIGVYAVAAFAARSRRRELAIRAALGAGQRQLIGPMLRRELGPVLVGLGLGLAVAVTVAPALFGGAFGISPRDAMTYVEVTALLLAVAVAATYIPLRSGGATSPSEALNA